MTTVATLIDLTLKDIGVLAASEAASGQDLDDAVATLNQMLAVWQTQNVLVYAQQVTNFSPDGSVSYTVGSGSTINMARPEKIDQAYWRLNGIDQPLEIIPTFEQYQAVVQKTLAGEPQAVFYLPSYSTGTLYVYPQASTGAIYLVSQVRLPTITSGEISIPPEYVLPMRANLAVLLCPMYGKEPSKVTVMTALNGLAHLKRNNLRLKPLSVFNGRTGNILSDIQ
jgi:hypothetical protein